ncbi:hypothetical protein [Caulobacter sp. NIBR1757]|uniref:hypothetical protein n=1 Tax=Caulobacter sp. NIBR1757 TaxID=3016000 RepID=UPI0022F0A808|nr:hypothetical protein [Caulobacter sp. NIBR1757]WGM39752.1 hypothetical protein AMEJIAPC_02679 [Caulobacter sp. NIBR1757]
MADLGYRSIEVNVVNDTRGNLTIQGPTLGSGNTWVQGEEPTQGASLGQYQGAKWGVSTNDVNGTATAMVQLTGLGSYPVSISFTNDMNGNSNCMLQGNDMVKGTAMQVSTGEMNHSLYNVQLIPGP